MIELVLVFLFFAIVGCCGGDESVPFAVMSDGGGKADSVVVLLVAGMSAPFQAGGWGVGSWGWFEVDEA